MLEKTFIAKDIESSITQMWEQSGLCEDPGTGKPYVIMMPPANVTGSLHLGHALTYSLQDILIRYHRLMGRRVLWQPGVDHAGIATQMVVERQLAQKGEPDRRTLGREKFIERIWDWKAESGGMIISQLKKLGASAAWSRERFTMDPHFNGAVNKVFCQLYKDGIIYRDKRLVNWDNHFQTAVSDIEVDQRPEKGTLWHIQYPLAKKAGSITVATTRPETLFGDVAVAVHPDDERYQHLIGQTVLLPLTGREIPIIGDEHADPEKGSGAVKITPAHDFNDFEVGRRHKLEPLNILTNDGHLNETVPEDFRGLSTAHARKKVLERLQEASLLMSETAVDHVIPHGERSGVVIEPRLTDQWFVDAAALAKQALAVVKKGETQFVPENWTKTYFDWLTNIQPWCISRQIWWGHQVPVWAGPDGTLFVEETEELAHQKARDHYGFEASLTRDQDVLDTWFSSALWPFVTLGWPDKTKELEECYPTSVLVTGFDIIFFWVARMMMMGLYFMKKVPFSHVYMHALVLDEKGQKMSKSKGNVIDPIYLINTYGADALRYTLASAAAPGRDIRISEQKVEGGRNFVTKIWNAARYVEMSGGYISPDFDPSQVKEALNRWIIQATALWLEEVHKALEHYRFNEAALSVYTFFWKTFCDWYLEATKPLLSAGTTEIQEETKQTLGWCLSTFLKGAHPFLPFVTETLWKEIAPSKTVLMGERWPIVSTHGHEAAYDEMQWVLELIAEVRSLRAELSIPAGAILPIEFYEVDPKQQTWLTTHQLLVERLGRLSIKIVTPESAPRGLTGTVQLVYPGCMGLLAVQEHVNIAAEQERLYKEQDKTKQEIVTLEARLHNPGFLAKAPEEVVDEVRAQVSEKKHLLEKIAKAQARLLNV